MGGYVMNRIVDLVESSTDTLPELTPDKVREYLEQHKAQILKALEESGSATIDLPGQQFVVTAGGTKSGHKLVARAR